MSGSGAEESPTVPERFHDRLCELVDDAVDAETAAEVAEHYPTHVVDTPECITGTLAEELLAITAFVRAEPVERVDRETDEEGSPKVLSVVIGGEDPNTGTIRETVRRETLWFHSAGVHEGNLHVRFRVVDPAEVDRCD